MKLSAGLGRRQDALASPTGNKRRSVSRPAGSAAWKFAAIVLAASIFHLDHDYDDAELRKLGHLLVDRPLKLVYSIFRLRSTLCKHEKAATRWDGVHERLDCVGLGLYGPLADLFWGRRVFDLGLGPNPPTLSRIVELPVRRSIIDDYLDLGDESTFRVEGPREGCSYLAPCIPTTSVSESPLPARPGMSSTGPSSPGPRAIAISSSLTCRARPLARVDVPLNTDGGRSSVEHVYGFQTRIHTPYLLPDMNLGTRPTGVKHYLETRRSLCGRPFDASIAVHTAPFPSRRLPDSTMNFVLDK
ncbi:hypothetical protein DFP72DRAFT_1152317 [Ephemerocybe angulata]|uniref:Uncharacterized protein n=1 Tax=Ephemerocybe angulata TaxID=980116 RepID=A0A8H6HHH0_9AGAR|nr:hypothetical protein DFP72DRAFT_1152317 [Tulosesus angulatus]